MMQKPEKGTALTYLLTGLLLLLGGSVMVLTGCYPGEVTSVQELDLVTTLFDKDVNFAGYKTYAMPDTIIHICDAGSQEQNCPSDLTRTNDNLILTQIEENLQGMGFTRSDPQDADVLVVTSANATDMYGYTSYYWYWDYWYGYPPGYGWYYPPATVTYQYTTGTLFITMFDPDKANENQQRLPAVWTALINGVIGSGGNTSSRLTTTINQAFDQSGYLGDVK
jgi:hypothetical protein